MRSGRLVRFLGVALGVFLLLCLLNALLSSPPQSLDALTSFPRGDVTKRASRHETASLRQAGTFSPSRYKAEQTGWFSRVLGYLLGDRQRSPFITQPLRYPPKSSLRTYLFGSVPKKTILLYSHPDWMQVRGEDDFRACAVKTCKLTTDYFALHRAAAVVVDVTRLPRDSFRPVFGKRAGQVWVALTQEAPSHCCQSYSFPGWAGLFNFTMSYRTDADFFFPSAMLVRKESPPRGKNYVAIAARKSKMAAWFVSNCFTQSKREQYVAELQRHLEVDVFGQCGPHKCPKAERERCRDMLHTDYRFYLAFENALCWDYVTEKFLDIFNNTDVIPVVRGHVDYDRYFPPSTFINAAHFPSPAALAAHLTALASDVPRYAAMLERKDRYETTFTLDQALCKLCEVLHSKEVQGQGHHYPDISEWFEADVCVDPEDINF